MMISIQRSVKWALTGGAFITVIVSAGCSRWRGATAQAPAQSVAPVKTVSEAGPFEASATPVVNVFGEFEGIDRGPVLPISTAGFQQHTYADEGADSSVAVDPTGKHIAFASTRHSEHSDIYLQKIDGVSVTKLTEDPADDAYPAFSPDGRQIAFSSNRSGIWHVYVMDIDGKNVTQITQGSTQDIHPSFSPDGTRLVFASLGSRSNQWELWTANLGTSEKRMIGYGLFPVWSPDKGSERIAFQRARQRGGRWFSLWTIDLIDGEARRLTEVAASANAAILSPSWSPDGKRLAFATIVEPTQINGKKIKGQQDVWVVNADGTNRQRLTDGNGANLSPTWSVDNRVFFVSDRGGNEAIWSVPAMAANTFTASAESKVDPTKKDKPEAMGATDSGEIGR